MEQNLGFVLVFGLAVGDVEEGVFADGGAEILDKQCVRPGAELPVHTADLIAGAVLPDAEHLGGIVAWFAGIALAVRMIDRRGFVQYRQIQRLRQYQNRHRIHSAADVCSEQAENIVYPQPFQPDFHNTAAVGMDIKTKPGDVIALQGEADLQRLTFGAEGMPDCQLCNGAGERKGTPAAQKKRDRNGFTYPAASLADAELAFGTEMKPEQAGFQKQRYSQYAEKHDERE